MATGFVCHELYMWHNTGSFAGIMPDGNPVQPDAHIEHPETKRRFRNLLEVSGLTESLVAIKPEPATQEQLCRFHTPEHVQRIRDMSHSFGGDAGGFTVMGRGSYEIALLSTGGVIQAMEAVLRGDVDNAYALVRPPGHHALPDEALGFCLFGNGVVAGLHALEEHQLDRIAYVDWDVHHGNSQQTAFYEDPRALTISVHQDNCFPPDSGHLPDNGEGKGAGYNINIPLPPGSGVGAYEAAFDQVVLPALEKFKPQLIMVPSGFDAGAYDPLGRMQMHSGGYRNLAAKLMAAADSLCGGRLVCSHEGGYNAHTVPFYGLAVLEQLSGISTGVEDPFLPIMAGLGGQALQPHQQLVIVQARALLDGIQ
jgi:acetoin utilization deacetylase AcuC-like enzyme